MKRSDALQTLADRICALPVPHPARVAIDGVDAAGKTTLADELIAPLAARGRPVIRASIDGFHLPRAERYQRGPLSPEGYYRDSFDYDALRGSLLLPLGPGGSRRYRRSVYNYRLDCPALAAEEVAPSNAALIMDGVFLLRPDLADLWEYRILLVAPFDVTLERLCGATPRSLAPRKKRARGIWRATSQFRGSISRRPGRGRALT